MGSTWPSATRCLQPHASNLQPCAPSLQPRVPSPQPHLSQVHSLREVTLGCVALSRASVADLHRVGPTLRHPFGEAPLATVPDAAISVAVITAPRCGSLALLPYLEAHARHFAPQPPQLWSRPALLHAHTSSRSVVLTVYREPHARLASLLRLLCSGRTRWAHVLCEALQLPTDSPARLAPALSALLKEGGARARLVRMLPIFTPFATFYGGATEVVAWSERSCALRAALVHYGVLAPSAPPISRAHESGGAAEAASAPELGRLLGHLWPEDERVAREDPGLKFRA